MLPHLISFLYDRTLMTPLPLGQSMMDQALAQERSLRRQTMKCLKAQALTLSTVVQIVKMERIIWRLRVKL